MCVRVGVFVEFTRIIKELIMPRGFYFISESSINIPTNMNKQIINIYARIFDRQIDYLKTNEMISLDFTDGKKELALSAQNRVNHSPDKNLQILTATEPRANQSSSPR